MEGKSENKSVNREYKDRLFKYIFGNENHKEFTLSLYNAINRTSYTSTDDIEITTIENAVYMGMHNDLSFIIADSMNLYEQQSTYNPNMPLRMLVYAGQLYDKFLETNGLKDNVFNSSILQIPYPRLMVFYNGESYQPDKTILKLSDAFNENAKGDIQVKVTMLNVNYGRNRQLLQRCRPLSDYSLFTTSVREFKRKNKNSTIDEAVEEALRLLPDDSEVRKLILEDKAGVAKMILFEYDEEAVLKAYAKDAEARGRAEGMAQGKAEVAKAMLAKGIDLNTTNQCTGIPVEDLMKLK